MSSPSGSPGDTHSLPTAAPPSYDELWARQWDAVYGIGPVHRHVCRIAVETIRPLGVRSVLDVGCGNGAILAAIQTQLGIEDVTGIDISPRALETASKRVRGVFRVMDMQEESPEGEFDLVISSQVIEHIDDDEAFLRKLRAVCGRYCFVGTIQGKMRKSEALVGHLRNYTRGELEDKMRRAGFDVEKVIEWGFPFFSPLYRSAIELAGGQGANLAHGKRERLAAAALYQLYRLNSSRRGDVLMALARAR